MGTRGCLWMWLVSFAETEVLLTSTVDIRTGGGTQCGVGESISSCDPDIAAGAFKTTQRDHRCRQGEGIYDRGAFLSPLLGQCMFSEYTLIQWVLRRFTPRENMATTRSWGECRWRESINSTAYKGSLSPSGIDCAFTPPGPTSKISFLDTFEPRV